MKNKFLSCLLAVVMVASLLVMPATAANTIDTAANSNIVVDLSAPTSVSDESVTYSNGMINLASEKWAEYTVNATAAGSYHIKFTRPSANRTEFYVNGEHITWRGGRKDDAATSTYELLNEVQLIKGANTIRVVAQSGKVGSISALNLVGLTQNRHTLQIRGVAPKAGSTGLTGTPDPQVYALVDATDENALWVTYEMTVPHSGYYYPAIAQAGPALEVTIDDYTLNMSNSTANGESYINGNLTTSWKNYNSPVYLEAKTYDVTFKTIAKQNGTQWYMALRGFALYEVYNCDGNDTFYVENVSIPANGTVGYTVSVDETTSFMVSYEGASSKRLQVSANDKIISTRTGGKITNDVEGDYAVTYHNEITLKPGTNFVTLNTTNQSAITAKKVTFTKLDNVQYTTSVYNHLQQTPHISYDVAPDIPVGNLRYSKKPAGTSATITAYIPETGYYYAEAALGGGVQFQPTVNGTALKWSVQQADRFMANCDTSYGANGFPYLRANKVLYLEEGNQEFTLTLPEGSENGDAYVSAVKFVKADVIDGNNTFSVQDVSISENGSVSYYVNSSETASFMVSYEGASSKRLQVSANDKIISTRTGGKITNDVEGDYAVTYHNEITLKPGINIITLNTTNQSAITAKKVTFTKLDNVQYTTSVYNHLQQTPHISYEVTPEIPVGNLRYSKKPAGTSATITAYVPEAGYYYAEAALGGDVQFQPAVNGTALKWSVQQTDRFMANCDTSYGANGFPYLRANKVLYLESGNQEFTLTLPEGSENGDAYVSAVKFVKADVIDGNNTFSVQDVSIAKNSSAIYYVNVPETTSFMASFEGASTGNIQIEANGKIINRRTGGSIISSEDGNHSRDFHNEITLNSGINTIKISEINGASATASKITFTKLDNVQYTTSVFDYAGSVEHISATVTPDYSTGHIHYSMKPAGTSATITAYVPEAGYYYAEASLGGAVQFQPTVNGTKMSWAVQLPDRFSANCGSFNFPYLRATKVLYLEAGNQEFTLTLPEGSENGDAYVGAVRFVKTTKPVTELVVKDATYADGNVVVNYEAPSSKNFTIIVASYTTENNVRKLADVAEPVSVTGEGKADSKTIPVAEGDTYEVFVWNNLTGITPLLTKTTATE